MDEEKGPEVTPPQQQPPAPPTPPAQGSSGMEPNLAALLSYLFGAIGGLIFFLIEKDDKYVRFHAMQSIAMNVVVIVAYIAVSIFSVVLTITGLWFLLPIVGLITMVLFLGFFVLWIIMMVKANQGEKYKLPVIGDFAEKQAG